MKFVDYTKICIKAGGGGNGCVSFDMLKKTTGGNGGDGGDIIVRSSSDLHTLADYTSKRHFKAKRGTHGSSNNKHGRKGKSCIMYVPTGTLIYQEDSLIIELDEDNMEHVLLEGARGGIGNHGKPHYRESSPITFGDNTEEIWLTLELKIFADVGIVGRPNVGKSTFLRAISNAEPKIGDYAFTTLYPELGNVYFEGYELLFADIPGIIDDSHEGRGLGYRFLRHIERCKYLIIVVDVTEDNIENQYDTIIHEISEYKESILDKEYIVAINKMEEIPIEDARELRSAFIDYTKLSEDRVFLMSGQNKTNTEKILKKIFDFSLKNNNRDLEYDPISGTIRKKTLS